MDELGVGYLEEFLLGFFLNPLLHLMGVVIFGDWDRREVHWWYLSGMKFPKIVLLHMLMRLGWGGREGHDSKTFLQCAQSNRIITIFFEGCNCGVNSDLLMVQSS